MDGCESGEATASPMLPAEKPMRARSARALPFPPPEEKGGSFSIFPPTSLAGKRARVLTSPPTASGQCPIFRPPDQTCQTRRTDFKIFLLSAPAGQALSLTYGRLYAEFLSGKSLVPLGLLALSTSVGLRYGGLTFVLLDFSRKTLHNRRPGKFLTFSQRAFD
jgi:hypothetical protein